MSVPYRTSNYSAYLNHVAALIGVDVGDFQSTELTFLNQFFNRALRKIWESQSWTDVCPFGEVRFPTNLLTYPNDYTQSAYWAITGANITAQALSNPMDARVTANSVLEAPNFTPNQHGFSQNVTFLPNQPYAISGWVRPNGRQFIQVSVNDGVNTYTSFFSLAQPSPSVGTAGGTGVFTANIQQAANGFLKWQLTFTSANTANSGSIGVFLSPDGVTTSYVTSSSVGAYFWGTTAFQTQNILPASFIIPWSQLGETAIDTVFSVWNNNPGGNFVPGRTNYLNTPNGIEIIGPTNAGAIYLYYRPQRPIFSGAAYNIADSYITGQSVQYTSTATLTNGEINYYSAIAPISPGQTPDMSPTLWSVTVIPYVMLEYCVFNAYADWLQTEGQAAKAQAMYAYAQTAMDDENDKQERQAGNIMPWRVNTHVTSQNRGMGYQGQIFSPSGSYFVN